MESEGEFCEWAELSPSLPNKQNPLWLAAKPLERSIALRTSNRATAHVRGPKTEPEGEEGAPFAPISARRLQRDNQPPPTPLSTGAR